MNTVSATIIVRGTKGKSGGLIGMKLKFRIVFDILLVAAAIAAFVYNFSEQRATLYISSVVAVGGTIALLVRDILKLHCDK